VLFETFFKRFKRDFEEEVREARRLDPGPSPVLPGPHLWKINGDEVLFTELVYPYDSDRSSALRTSVRAFVQLVRSYDREFLPEGMGLRGCVWTAGFPIRNRSVRIHHGIRRLRTDSVDFETGEQDSEPAAVTDYIGRDMDLGFRLAAVTPPSRVCCSLDAAEYLLSGPTAARLYVFHVGWRRLKGILGGSPYPVLLLDDQAVPEARHPWEPADTETPPEVSRLLDPRGNGRLGADELTHLANSMREQFPEHLIRPYASEQDMVRVHRETWATGAPEEISISDSSSMGTRAIEAPASTAPTITLDELNQLALYLQSEPSTASALGGVLREVASEDAYASWARNGQFGGLLFRMPRGLVFANEKQRRLLERLLLVEDDVLRVKINVCGSRVFITDGLWVSGEFRVNSFSDESDLVMRTCAELGWHHWATCVIDPATGCGHNLLRYEGSDVRRYGFDINARALAYAAINAAINGIEASRVGLNDVRSGIPPVFTQNEAERVLVLANMPFALGPEPETLPKSAQGGRYGYELTRDLLDSISALRQQLRPESELRAVVLTYTVGNRAADAWVVPQHASQLFTGDRTEWRVWEDEPLWRINGKKEQPNPMPLNLLSLKADCRFYVHDDANRDIVRDQYRRLTGELAEHEWDHLAYGVVTIW
jgi:hypothetical protein